MTEPKLPPGWGVREHPSHPFIGNGEDASSADVAWRRFEMRMGITRAKWEAMERDHRAMQAVRAGSVELDFSEGPPPRWRARQSGNASWWYVDDPADAILAALGD